MEVTFITWQFTSTMILIITKVLINVGQETPRYEPFFLLPEGVWVEKSLQTKRPGQFHTQVGPVHMGANGHMWGGRFFMAPLNLVMIDPLGGPNINTKGVSCEQGWWPPEPEEYPKREPLCLHAPLATDARALDQHFQTLGEWLSYGSSGSQLMPPGRGWGHWWGCVE